MWAEETEPSRRPGLAVPGRAGPASVEVDALRATCRDHALVIDALKAEVSSLRAGNASLMAENAALRAESDRTHNGHADPGVAELHLRMNSRAPAAARGVVTRAIRDRVPVPVLETARLLVSELVTNSVLHGGVAHDGSVVVRLQLNSSELRVEVEDPGRADAIVRQTPDLDGGGGFGLNLVSMLSERWGLECAAAGGTRVWAQISRTPVAPEIAQAS